VDDAVMEGREIAYEGIKWMEVTQGNIQ